MQLYRPLIQLTKKKRTRTRQGEKAIITRSKNFLRGISKQNKYS